MSTVHDYAPSLARAQANINRKGRTVTIHIPSTTPINAAKPWVGTTGETAPVTKGVFVPLSGAGSLGMSTNIEDYAERPIAVCMVAGGVDYDDAKTLVSDGITYRVVGHDKLMPGDTELLHFFVLAN